MSDQLEGSYRSVFLRSPLPMWVFDQETLRFLEVNEAAIRRYGYSREEFLGMTIRDIRPPEDVERLETYLEAHIGTDAERVVAGFVHRRKDGGLLDVEITSSPIVFAGRPARLVLAYDVSDHTRYERRLQALAEASAEIASAESLQDALQHITDRTREILGAHLGMCTLTPTSDWTEATTALSLSSRYADHVGTPGLHDGSGIYSLVRESGQPLRLTADELAHHPRRRGFGVAEDTHPPLRGLVAAPLQGPDGWCIGLLMVSDSDAGDFTQADEAMLVQLARLASDAIERGRLRWTVATSAAEITKLNASLHRQLDRMDGLRQVDRAITSSLDLNLTLAVFLDQVTTHLGVDAGAVLLHDASARSLRYAALRGLRTTSLRSLAVKVGEGTLGRIVLEREARLEDLAAPDASHPALVPLRDEGFVTSLARPLIAKGIVVGVLELFHRGAIALDAEQAEYLDALVDQGAIVIDNGVLFNRLERANVELVQAYDTTIEGWAAALDRRGSDPPGHSRRVADLSVRTGQLLQVDSEDLHWIRRGALLHDIGNLGVPEVLLRKPGPLDEEEWARVRTHPDLAREFLDPIPFLRKALDIPCAHHERWDGSGYPQGLSGETIPLPARIFMVSDVFDAMTAGRPYSAPVPRGEAVAYLRRMRGTLFDPHVVDAFFRTLESAPEQRM